MNGLSRRLGRGSGTVIGGRVALAIDPHALERLSAHRHIILVSGTNGKTTTTALIAEALGGAARNVTGSNMPAGHVAALASDTNSVVVLETDEAYLPEVIARTRPRVVCLLNLSRDQLDRAAEVRVMAEKWRAALHDTDATVVANASDPLVTYAAIAQRESRVVWVGAGVSWSGDARSCPQCTEPLNPEGTWRCDCGFARPDLDAELGDTLRVGDEEIPLSLALPGAFNRSNAALAALSARELGIPVPEAVERMASLGAIAGRFTLRRRANATWRLLLAKNPAGVAALIDLVGDATHVVVSINDRVADGFDPSWLYDAPFDRLRGRHVWCSGDRALDVATRLDYADVDVTVCREGVPSIPGDEVVDVIANYTAFAEWMENSEPC